MGLVVQGAAVLNRWSASWRDQSRHERVGGVGGAGSWPSKCSEEEHGKKDQKSKCPEVVCAAHVRRTPGRSRGR